MNKNEPFTIMCVRNLDTGISGYYVCDDSGLTKVLTIGCRYMNIRGTSAE
ncbi:MAG: hypothetical protein ACLTDF_04710 [Coprococcus sp.]